MKHIAATILLTLLALTAQEAAAAGCYSTNYQKAEELFRQGSYSAAIKRYRAAKACPDKPKSNNIDARISECNRRLNPPAPTYYLYVDDLTANRYIGFPARGGSRTFSVSTNASSWDTQGVPSWCSVSRSSSGFSLTCEDNRTASSRSGYMTIQAGGKEVRIDFSQPEQTLKIESFYVVHNQYQDGKKGMVIHLNITSDNIAKDGTCEITLFRKNNGRVIGKHFEKFPLNPPISHKDFQIFFPYKKLDITASGSCDIEGQIGIFSNLEVICVDMKTFDFTYTP